MTQARTVTTGSVRVRVPGKINLFLAVRGRRPDGMHQIVTVMQTVALYDEVVARFEGGGEGHLHPARRRHLEVILRHDAGPAVPTGADNLAVRAAHALAERIGGGEAATPRPSGSAPVTHLELTKRIPVAAGMAGGSADAAAALVALNELWDAGLDRDELRGLAAELGADVPFCVDGGTALATGTGTATAQILCRGTFHWVVGMDAEPLSTAEVYRAWDSGCRPGGGGPDAVVSALRSGDPAALGAGLHNDLQQAAFLLRPDLVDARGALLEAGALGAVVSGSGPTVVGLAGDRHHAGEVAGRVRGIFHRVEVVSSPAGGPEIVPRGR